MKPASWPRLGLFAALVPFLPLSPARAEGAPETISTDAVRDKMILLTDGKDHYVAVVPLAVKREKDYDPPIFYGDGKRFFGQRVRGYSANGDAFSYRFVDPRLTAGGSAEGEGDVRFDGKVYTLDCGERSTKMQVVDPRTAAPLLSGASFVKGPRKWRPFALARDSRGNYYYVDRGITKDTEQQYRLFAGPKGNMKQQKMTNVVADSEGHVFATKTGSLRMVVGKDEVTWIEKKKPQKLTNVPVDFNRNVAMIYNEFGIYTGERLGTPCDDL